MSKFDIRVHKPKLSDIQVRLLDHINAGNEVYITTWGGEVATNLPFGNVATIRKLYALDLVKAKHEGSSTTYSKR